MKILIKMFKIKINCKKIKMVTKILISNKKLNSSRSSNNNNSNILEENLVNSKCNKYCGITEI